jgi:NADH dehydrogenase (ubiquinone) 1 alpha subcomplex subunit 9
MIVLKKGVPV